MTNQQVLPDPSRCYVDGCDRENDLLLHVADDPWLGGDFCMDHVRSMVGSTPLILTCECPFCARARRVVSSLQEPPRLEGPGRWLVSTESSSYLLELGESGSGTVVRHVGEGQGPAPEAEGLPPAVAVGLRRDAEQIPVHWAEVPVVGRPWRLQVDVRGDGTPTIRRTTFVRQVVTDPSE
ncbi:hypothetical protein [Nocardioides antri]|uniref:Uncharacterized protein n=1 Tax=Nocardioides antri TaxID=2607659 RepID=A0A5B1M0Z6_9ACTN|nr:hypothetical protein [Nocardioides antri]KAA1426602.1 hypothetical protein F0U47_14550 [Nocardioides antri]